MWGSAFELRERESLEREQCVGGFLASLAAAEKLAGATIVSSSCSRQTGARAAKPAVSCQLLARSSVLKKVVDEKSSRRENKESPHVLQVSQKWHASCAGSCAGSTDSEHVDVS